MICHQMVDKWPILKWKITLLNSWLIIVANTVILAIKEFYSMFDTESRLPDQESKLTKKRQKSWLASSGFKFVQMAHNFHVSLDFFCLYKHGDGFSTCQTPVKSKKDGNYLVFFTFFWRRRRSNKHDFLLATPTI